MNKNQVSLTAIVIAILSTVLSVLWIKNITLVVEQTFKKTDSADAIEESYLNTQENETIKYNPIVKTCLVQLEVVDVSMKPIDAFKIVAVLDGNRDTLITNSFGIFQGSIDLASEIRLSFPNKTGYAHSFKLYFSETGTFSKLTIPIKVIIDEKLMKNTKYIGFTVGSNHTANIEWKKI